MTSNAASAADSGHAQQLANWVSGQLVARIGEQDPATSNVTPAALATLVELVSARELTNGTAREVLDVLLQSGGDPRAIVAERGHFVGVITRIDLLNYLRKQLG